MVKNSPANAGDVDLLPALRRSPGEGNSNPLQYSCLGNPMEPSGLQSMGSQRIGHDLVTKQQESFQILGPGRPGDPGACLCSM